MAIEKQLKDARGYQVYDFLYHELSQGVRPTLGPVAKPANWLPVALEDKHFNEWWVLLAGTIVSMDKTLSGINRIVPAIGAAAQNIVYTANDIGYTVDVDTVLTDPTLVATAHTATAQIPANKPIGWSWFHYYSSSVEDRLINYEIQPFVSIVCDYEIEMPLIDDISGVQNFLAGDLVKPGVTGSRYGLPHKWVSGSDSAELICGRILYRDTIPYGVNSRSRIDLQKPVRGLGLPGRENDGRPSHLDAYQLAAPSTRVTDFVRINIALL